MAGGGRIELAIGEIAAKHGIGLSRDDPMLMLLTINEWLLAAGEEQQRKLLESFISGHGGEVVRVQAKQALQQALATSWTAMQHATQQSTAATTEGLRALVQSHASQTAAQLKTVRKVAVLDLGGAGAGLGVAILGRGGLNPAAAEDS